MRTKQEIQELEQIKELEKQIENLKKQEKILKLEQQIEDLQKVKNLFYEAYNLQNSGTCILHNHYFIDDDLNYLNNEFYKITQINTSSPLYKAELKTEELINKLTIELETLKK